MKKQTCVYVLAAGLIATACSQKAESQPAWPVGWSRDTNPGWPGVIYRFGDATDTTLYGRCHGHAVFMLARGGYRDEFKSFKLITDGSESVLGTYYDRHHGGRFLSVEEPADVEKLASARTITFRVGTWERSLAGNPLIADFIKTCQSWPPPKSGADAES